jgi:hypothetical protein
MKLYYKSESIEEQREIFQKVANLGIPYFYSTNLGGKYMGCAVYDDGEHLDNYPLTLITSYTVKPTNTKAIVSSWSIDDDYYRSSMKSFMEYIKEEFNINGIVIKKSIMKHEIL